MVLIGVSAHAQQPGAHSVTDYGATGDGVTDDTEAFQAALAAAAETHGYVYVPFGRYAISEPLPLDTVGLMGPPVAAWPADVDSMPTIVPLHRDGPAFHMGQGASLQGLDITYEWQAEPEDGPPAVLISGIGCLVRDMRIRYAWDGILTDGVNNVGRLNIQDVFMVSIRNVGVRVTGTWDVPALRNIEVWNAGPVPRPLNEGVGFHLGKNDLIRVTDCFAFAMGTGFLIEDEIEGLEIEGGTWGILTGCSTDYCPVGVMVRGDNTVSISGGTFWEHAESLIVDGDGARVRLTGAELRSNSAPCVDVRAADHVVVTGCSLLRSMDGFDAPAVVWAGGRLVLQGNMIEARGQGIVIGDGRGSGIIQGNLISCLGGEGIVGRTELEPDIAVSGNLITDVPPPPETEGED
jgi:hypothetical protein